MCLEDLLCFIFMTLAAELLFALQYPYLTCESGLDHGACFVTFPPCHLGFNDTIPPRNFVLSLDCQPGKGRGGASDFHCSMPSALHMQAYLKYWVME